MLLEKVSLDYVHADGSTHALTREVYRVGDGAALLPCNAVRRMVILVRQFRLPDYPRGGSGFLLEAPAEFLDGDDPIARIKKRKWKRRPATGLPQ